MLLSIIIPIYNVEKYLPRCLNSIFNQGANRKDYEVICIIDGSPDRSAAVAQRYAKQHPNLKLHTQRNQGVSATRNKGITMATGDYLAFVDPDDTLANNALRKLLRTIRNQSQPDMVISKLRRNGHTAYPWKGHFLEHTPYTGTEILNSGLLLGSVCGTIFKRTFILRHNIHFIEGILNGEDTNFALQACYFSYHIEFLNAFTYQVIGRQGSASSTFTPQRIDHMIDSVKKVQDCRDLLSMKQGNRIALDYMVYASVHNLVKDTIRTPGIGYKYLLRSGVKPYSSFPIAPQTRFLRRKMQLLNKSFRLYYLFNKASALQRKLLR